jgi:hypothetical protein
VFVLATGAYAQAGSIAIPYQKFVLDNGLPLIAHEDRKAPHVLNRLDRAAR